ncbi:DUF3466 family protein [Shewanella fidelis]|uniref:DUF3466 family protein n=1 Tax=Shewanella fidelis TaxID=173509 RepID=A0AAW8NP28_9GAMM|nr:DUF3466 family protein [Shewanella fidelis]MDR8523683.1 DUF3466 family protein [Shewanella fidelis]MDW4810230.1 DUF3466 family protein [Shewanella fidelis]MDW4814375.1 DUF3466 family protein [Shewanella fidelis]MDW4818466.1 DUF3466 family protein [Shewanella fidelis]MDW4823882.1 DUF3466 family protein [Shewanella fidelis]
MKFKLDKTLSLVAVGVISVLQGVHAAPVYEIINIDLDTYDLNGTIANTRNGYGMAVNSNNEAVGVAKGKKKLTVSEEDDGVIDIEDGVADSETITYSVNLPIIANNFTFNSIGNAWIPTFESVNGTTAPTFPEDEDTVNSVDTFFYGINDSGLKVGAMTSAEKTVPYDGSSETQEFWYYRDYEQRGFVKQGSDAEIELLPPFTDYVYKEGEAEEQTISLGGISSGTAVNQNGLITGYASTDISENSGNIIDSCVDNNSETAPQDICIQAKQFPNQYGISDIKYQIRGYVWQYDAGVLTPTMLPLGLEVTNDSVYSAQGLGINNEGSVAGRSYVYRDNNKDRLYYDAAYWTKDAATGEYKYNWVDVDEARDVYSSIAYDINDNGILVGSYNKYINGYRRDKFFYFDTKNPETPLVTPNDFYNNISDLSSRGRDINNQGQVVGYIETTHDKEKPRPKAGFLYQLPNSEFPDGEFKNLNDLLTCESKGYEQNAEGNWQRNEVEVTDGDGKTLTYKSDILIVEANSINEDGTIVGTAFIRKPSYKFDDDGNLVIGDDGLPFFQLNGNGEPVTSYLPRMVVLQPAGATAEACTVVDEDDKDENYVRKGAASFAWLFALPLLWFRRRMK